MGSYVFHKNDFDANGELKPPSQLSPTSFSMVARAYTFDPEALWQQQATAEIDANGYIVGSAEARDAERAEHLNGATSTLGAFQDLLENLSDGILADNLLAREDLDQMDLIRASGHARSEALPALVVKGSGGAKNRVIVGDAAIDRYLKSHGIDPSQYERTTIGGVIRKPEFNISDYREAFKGDVELNPAIAKMLKKYPDRAEYVAMAADKAKSYGLNVNMFLNQIMQESGFNPSARSGAGAIGLGQLMPGTANALGVKNPWDPEQNLEGAAKLMKRLTIKYGYQENALIAYNGGDGAMGYAIQGTGIYNPKDLKPEIVAGFFAKVRNQRVAAGLPLLDRLWCVQSANYQNLIAFQFRSVVPRVPDRIENVVEAGGEISIPVNGDANAGKPTTSPVPAEPTTATTVVKKPENKPPPAANNGAAAGGQPTETPPAAAAGKPGDPPTVVAAAQSLTVQVPPPPKPRVAATRSEPELEPA